MQYFSLGNIQQGIENMNKNSKFYKEMTELFIKRNHLPKFN